MYLAYNFLTSLYVGIASVIFNLYIIRLGYNEQFLGLIISVTMIATGLFAFPAAQVCGWIGSKKSLLASCIVSTVVSFLLYVMTSREWLLMLSLLSGIFSTVPVIIAAPFMVENSTAEDRIYLFSFNFALFVVATVLGMAIGGYLPQVWSSAFGVDGGSALSYRYTLYASVAVAIASIIPLIFLKEKKKVCVGSPAVGPMLAELARSRVVKRLVAISCLIGLGAGLIVPFFNVYFSKMLSATPGQIGLIFAMAQASMAVGAMAVPCMVSRIGKVKTVSLTYLLSIPFLVILAITTNLYIAGAAYILRMLFMNMSVPISNSFSMEIVHSEEMASVSSLTSMGSYISIAVSSYVAGVLMSYGFYILPYVATCLFYLAAAVLYSRFFSRYEARHGSGTDGS
ncbi:MFS transporter [Methanocella conradii]|uniref:MFS transporter n=1 Tax=Methanocella conradii TaxID=1175444 RepID=UPI0024B348DA|nr:MFS transporter [Methanocella conradii]MDI6897342.1 MFS transporter [Methanocella conradii]